MDVRRLCSKRQFPPLSDPYYLLLFAESPHHMSRSSESRSRSRSRSRPRSRSHSPSTEYQDNAENDTRSELPPPPRISGTVSQNRAGTLLCLALCVRACLWCVCVRV